MGIAVSSYASVMDKSRDLGRSAPPRGHLVELNETRKLFRGRRNRSLTAQSRSARRPEVVRGIDAGMVSLMTALGILAALLCVYVVEGCQGRPCWHEKNSTVTRRRDCRDQRRSSD